MIENLPQTNARNIEKVVETVNKLQQDMTQVGSLVGRLDITIEKLTEVSTTVSQLLAVQGNRIEFHEKEAEKVSRILDERRNEQNIHIKEVYTRIEHVENDLRREVHNSYQKVSDKIDSTQTNADASRKEFNKELTDRIGRLEKWIWSLAGGSLVAIWVLNNLDLLLYGY